MREYQAPSVTTWGTITDLTQGQGETFETDEFETCLPNKTFVGSNDNDNNACTP